MDVTLNPSVFAAVNTAAKRMPLAAAMPERRLSLNGPERDVFFSGRKGFRYSPESNQVARLVALGTDAATRNKVGFRVSRYFSADGRDHDTTYGQMLEDIQRTAAGFRKLGLSGKRIAVAETNTLDFLSTYYGGLAVGATMLPINLLAMQDEYTKIANLTHMVGGAQSDAFVFGADELFKPMHKFKTILWLRKSMLRKIVQSYVDALPPEKQDRSRLATLFRKLPENLQLVTPAQKTKMRRLKPLSIREMTLNPDPASISDVIFTSGTSGKPKGVALSHENLVFTAMSLNQAVDDILRPDDVMLVGLPLFHIFGKAVQMTGIQRGTQMVLLPSLRAAIADLGKVGRTIKDYRVTVLPSVPIFLEKLVAHAERNPETREALRQIRVIISGGAPLRQETYDALKAINPDMQILEGYGSSEGGINMLNKAGIPGFVGHELPGVEAKMIENNPNAGAFYGWSKSEGEGEILVRSPGVSRGYVSGTVEATDPSQAKNGLIPIADAHGWYHTGDQGRRLRNLRDGAIPGEKASLVLGPMQIIGRESNFIKDSGGERRDPSEFEKAVRTAEPRILDAMAVAYRPDRETEKSVVVAVTEEAGLSETDIKQAMGRLADAGKLAGALIPKHIIVLRRSTLPDAFRNDFKRETGYKAARDFVAQAVAENLVDLREKTGAQREHTMVDNRDALERFAEDYRYSGQ